MHIGTQTPRVIAALGPTNTGKTHLAVERMLSHESGIIGFPLRLLARENYDRALAIKGVKQVALITGEEKIVPPYAKYFFCTVESMPANKKSAFLAVDEIQLCCDRDRGHIFTQRLLHARGLYETMFMGAEVIAPILKKIIPEVIFKKRERYSSLKYSGSRKLGQISPRSAIVGFSTENIYALAEVMTRRKGGAAIVMGSLSPRTRNAQVNLFQNGDVDYLVATDAIGMGLNMDVKHVAFSAIHKFDGKVRRPLGSSEIAQIAGRAGRYTSDGTFGVTGNLVGLNSKMVAAIEGHKFDPLKFLYWRNKKLDFTNLRALELSLNQPSNNSLLVRVESADDEFFLRELSQDPEIFNRISNKDDVRLIWELCQVPDFRKISGDEHARFLKMLYFHLSSSGCLPTDWVASEITRLDNVNGDIDTLLGRIAGIRVWTYIANRFGWLEDSTYWRQKTREIEDTLSDVLHHGLMQRFVDRRTAVLVKRLKTEPTLSSKIGPGGEVFVEGQLMGKLDGFRYIALDEEFPVAGKGVQIAVRRALCELISRQVKRLIIKLGDDPYINENGQIEWNGSVIGRLVRGATPLSPNFDLLASDLLNDHDRRRVEGKLNEWLRVYIRKQLKPLFQLHEANLEGAARGIAFRFIEGFGFLPRNWVGDQVKSLTARDHGTFRRLGLKIGRNDLFMPALLKPSLAAIMGTLWSVFYETKTVPYVPNPSIVSFLSEQKQNVGLYQVMGFRLRGPLFIRVDMLERFIGQIRKLESRGLIQIGPELLNLLGCDEKNIQEVLASLGYEQRIENGAKTYHRVWRTKMRNKALRPNQIYSKKGSDESSPFQILKTIVFRP